MIGQNRRGRLDCTRETSNRDETKASEPACEQLDTISACGYLLPTQIPGGLAQLGERLHGMQEVIGSSPLSSTRFDHTIRW